MTSAQRAIDPRDFSSIPRIKDRLNKLNGEIRICPVHDESVWIHEADFLPNPGPGAPFAKADWFACCPAAVDRVIGEIVAQNLNQ
jgi:hypothetical protein